MARRPGVARGLTSGDVRLIELASPDKVRPAIVVTRTSAIPYLNALSVVPITRTVRDVPRELSVGVAEGLKVVSAANLHAIQTVPRVRVGRYLGALQAERRRALRDALLFAFGLDDVE